MSAFEEALGWRRPTVIDGGLATELEAQGHDIGTSLWSAALLHSHPSAIVDAHRAFLEAGAEIIISASYQASAAGFMSLGLSQSEAEALIARSVELACEARQQYCDAHPEVLHRPLVAASVGPYGATLHDGSEYTGRYDINERDLARFHEQRLQLLDVTEADLLACETIPSQIESEVLRVLLQKVRLPAWVSFCCRNGKELSDGTSLGNACAPYRGHPRVRALGVNCTAPQFVTSLIGEIRIAVPDMAIVVYPNAGESYQASANAWSGEGSAVSLAEWARNWREAGAAMIGGCCRIGPAQIATLPAALAD